MSEPISEMFVHNGIVDKVRAVRRNDEVQYLEASVHLKFDEDDYQGQYGGTVTADLAIPLPATTKVNPGDVVAVHMQFVNPFGQRFVPALEVSEPDELDEDDPSVVSHDSDLDDENLDTDDELYGSSVESRQ